MKRCRHCLTRRGAVSDRCAVCGLPPDAAKKELSAAEHEVRLRARLIRGVALLHLIGGSLALLLVACLPVPPAAVLALAAINLLLAAGLSRYAFWAYRAATVWYFLVGMVNIISVNIPGILMILLLLYCIGNSSARALFERNLAER